MEKAWVEKLIKVKSDRVAFESNKGVSDVWPSFVLVNIDTVFSSFVKCLKCEAVLKWKSRDSTSGLKNHLKSCDSSKREIHTQELTAMPFFTSITCAGQKRIVSAADKHDLADVMVTMCAKDIR